jgi:hypothetical protein
MSEQGHIKAKSAAKKVQHHMFISVGVTDIDKMRSDCVLRLLDNRYGAAGETSVLHHHREKELCAGLDSTVQRHETFGLGLKGKDHYNKDAEGKVSNG